MRQGEGSGPSEGELRRYELVENETQFNELLGHLKGVKEMAVDIEHVHRDYHGKVCLLQISTRDKDYIIDPLKGNLYAQVRLLRPYFLDSGKVKIFHGADSDIRWLLKHFEISVVNFFDTQLADKAILGKEAGQGRGLVKLLKEYLQVEHSKEFQNVKWDKRPLQPELLRYAQRDSHHLLSLYDRLLEIDPNCAAACASSLEKIYEQELNPRPPYFNMINKHFNGKAAAITVHVALWRDKIALERNIHTGYLLSKKKIIELALELGQEGKVDPTRVRKTVEGHMVKDEKTKDLFNELFKDLLRALSAALEDYSRNQGLFDRLPEELNGGSQTMTASDNLDQ